MKFTMQRDLVVATTTGHSIEFKKGQPTYVPPAAHADVIARGAVPDEELPMASKGPGDDAVEREAKIQEAIATIVTRNKPEDFTAGNTPHAKVISQMVGFTVDAGERDVQWQKFQTPKA